MNIVINYYYHRHEYRYDYNHGYGYDPENGREREKETLIVNLIWEAWRHLATGSETGEM